MEIPKEAIEKAKRNYMRRPQKWMPHPNEEEVSIAFIETPKGSYGVLVNYDDLPKVMGYRWYLRAGYAVTSIAYKRVKMHHLIAGVPSRGMEVDHINRHRLDNRRINLRTIAANDNRKNTAGKGYRKRGERYEVYIGLNGKQKSLGTFATEAEARAVYESARQERINSIAA